MIARCAVNELNPLTPPRHQGANQATGWSILLGFVFLLGCWLWAVLGPGSGWTLLATEGKAAEALEKIMRKLPAEPRFFSIEITPLGMIVVTPSASAPGHLDEFRYVTPTFRRSQRQSFPVSWVVGPRPAQPSMLHGRIEESLFMLKDIDFTQVVVAAREAERRVALEGGGRTVSINIRRPQRVLAEMPSGDVEWDLSVRGPRESASATAAARGRIRQLDLRGTRRAEVVDYRGGGDWLTSALATIRVELGGARIFEKIEISRTSVDLHTRDPQRGAARYSCGVEGLKSLPDSGPAAHLFALARSEPRRVEPFGLDDADWARVPEIGAAALRAVPLAGAHVANLVLTRAEEALAPEPLWWRARVQVGLIMGESGEAFFDARTGELADLVLPRSLQRPTAFLTPGRTRPLLERILAEVGPEARFIDVQIHPEKASVGATSGRHPAELRRYSFEARPRALVGAVPTAVDDRSVREVLFPAAELAALAARIETLRERGFARLGMKDGKVEVMSLFRQNPVHPRSEKLLVQMHCTSPTIGNGQIIYDVDGREFYVALP